MTVRPVEEPFKSSFDLDGLISLIPMSGFSSHTLFIGYNLRHEIEPAPGPYHSKIHQVWLGSFRHARRRLPDLRSRFLIRKSAPLPIYIRDQRNED